MANSKKYRVKLSISATAVRFTDRGAPDEIHAADLQRRERLERGRASSGVFALSRQTSQCDFTEDGKCIASRAFTTRSTVATQRTGPGWQKARNGWPLLLKPRELLGGYYLIEARDLDEAIEIGSTDSGRHQRHSRDTAGAGDRWPAGPVSGSGGLRKVGKICVPECFANVAALLARLRIRQWRGGIDCYEISLIATERENQN